MSRVGWSLSATVNRFLEDLGYEFYRDSSKRSVNTFGFPAHMWSTFSSSSTGTIQSIPDCCRDGTGRGLYSGDISRVLALLKPCKPSFLSSRGSVGSGASRRILVAPPETWEEVEWSFGGSSRGSRGSWLEEVESLSFKRIEWFRCSFISLPCSGRAYWGGLGVFSSATSLGVVSPPCRVDSRTSCLCSETERAVSCRWAGGGGIGEEDIVEWSCPAEWQLQAQLGLS